MNKPKTLIFDIETSPMLAYVWDKGEQMIGLNQIKTDWYVMAWGAKWLNDPVHKVIYYDQRKARNIENDKAILKPLWTLLNQADIVITQNGKNFDSPKINARFILHGMNPPSPYKHLDTYQIIRRVAKFTSNKLEYLTNKLCKKYKKLDHGKYPGMELWKQCLAKNKEAWEEMKRYNIHDVLATEELFNVIQQWTPQSMPNVHHACPSRYLQKRGRAVAGTQIYQRYQCQKCCEWVRGEEL